MYNVSLTLNGKVRRKNFKTELGALRAISRWLQQHPDNASTLAMLYGPNIEPTSYTQESDLPELATKPTDFYRSQAWIDIRYQALVKYGNRCACCGRTAASGATLHVDHIKPRSSYPQLQLDLDNLQVLCDLCNLGKSNKSEEQWR